MKKEKNVKRKELICLTQPRTENKMGVMPVNRLLVSMAAPMMISMLVQALYNVVDTMFVSRLGKDALTALSLAFSIQNLMIAVAVGTGVGINALLSRSLGEKEFERANKTAENGLFLAGINYIIFLFIGIFFSRSYFSLFGASEAVVEYGAEYLSICCILSFGVFGQITFERILQSVGKTMLTMVTQMIGAVLNIILDPIMIYGLLGFPKMGVAGAALATVIGQIIAFIAGIILNHKFNHEVRLNMRSFRPDGAIIKNIYSVGVPSIIMGSIGSVMTVGINQIVRICGSVADTAQAVFGVYFKLQSFVFMPVFGLNNGMVPIIAYNFGAKKRDRLTKTIKLSVLYACILMLIGFLLFQFMPETLLRIFDTGNDDMAGIIEVGVPALRRISYSFVFAGFCIVILSVFQALGHGFLSLGVSAMRQLGVLLPAAFILAVTTHSVEMVWLAFPIAEIASVTLSSLCLVHVYKKEIKNL